jgi:hypothetical protein
LLIWADIDTPRRRLALAHDITVRLSYTVGILGSIA